MADDQAEEGRWESVDDGEDVVCNHTTLICHARDSCDDLSIFFDCSKAGHPEVTHVYFGWLGGSS
jgi:hypothetical protein